MKQRGFSLIEIMVVLVIMSVLIGMVAANYLGRGDAAKVQVVSTDFATIESALEMYYLEVGSYPSSDQGLSALMSQPSGLNRPERWNGPYLKKTPTDPWGNSYDYFYVGSNQYELVSYGADGAEGGSGLDADISNVAD